MKKKYPILSINGKMYMVDKERDWNKEMVEGDWYTSHTGKILQVKSSYMEDDRSLRTNFLDHHLWSFPLFKILAGPKELGLPLLPSIEEDPLKIKDAWIRQTMEVITSRAENLTKLRAIENLWSFCEKAASKKQYTEEDMRQAYAEGILNQQRRSLYGNFEQFLNALNSLTPIPIAVEVEMKHLSNRDARQEKISDGWYVPEVDKQGFIIVKKWIYE